MGEPQLKIIHEDCDPKLAENRKLPYTAYLVEYIKEVETEGKKEQKTCYDITLCQKQVEMFDHYYDTYKKGLKGWKQTQGTISPKLWNESMINPKKETKPKKPQKKKNG
tara:strand:- start:2046 stop:2372 length:327 start_codon:yes stop_codon:yes gene_type:complete